ncbi:hypothetical protein Acr_00g0079060 [Actinidia rufa]|uniref:Uncharacterized protein n=1 Tax=Actinidia rufa TaxID=165716 RepID=A0A7J0DU21_9ERIC|nr:hypothetical protein Acr_00g0079060 [Actinidia rufa]
MLGRLRFSFILVEKRKTHWILIKEPKPAESDPTVAIVAETSTALHGKSGYPTWILDSGAKNHMSGELATFTSHVTSVNQTDLTSKKILGRGYERDGLYYFGDPLPSNDTIPPRPLPILELPPPTPNGSLPLIDSQNPFPLAQAPLPVSSPESGMLGCKPVSTPMVPNLNISAESGKLLPDPSIYQRLVGHLIYLTNTRPNLTFAVSIVSQFMHSPRTAHLDAVYHILRYLKTCPDLGLFWVITPNFVSSSAQTADMFTKSIGPSLLKSSLIKLVLVNIFASA